MTVRRYFALIVLSALACYNGCLGQLLHPYNLDFEEGKPTGMPAGWELPEYALKLGYKASITSVNPFEGRNCLELRNEAEFREGMYGSVMQSVDAAPFRGRRVRFTAAVRSEIHSTPGSAHLWISERMFDNEIGFLDAMEDKPIVMNEWKIYQITGDITQDAKVVNFGLMLKGTGLAWIDKATFEFINDNASAFEPPRPLSNTEAVNIASFARLAGYVRYFCPSIESQSLNWDKFIYYGIKSVEQAGNNDQLAGILDSLFKPIAPAIEIFKDKKAADAAAKDRLKPPANAMKNVALAWKHTGPKTEAESKVFSSEPVNVYNSQREREGAVTQLLDATHYRGSHLVFSSSVKANVIPPSGQAQLWLRVDGPDERIYSTQTMFDRPITSNKWNRYTIEADVPADATVIRLGLVLVGDGEAWFDDTKLTAISGVLSESAEPKNPGFEEGPAGKVAFGWRTLPASEKSGYEASISQSNPFSGKQCLYLSSQEATRVRLPAPGETVSAALPSGLAFTMPVALFVDSSHTLPYPPAGIPAFDETKNPAGDYSAKDRTSRLAITVNLWNIFRHFNLAASNDQAWNDVLLKTLLSASADTSEISFARTLRLMLPVLNDAQARVWHENETYRYFLPFLMKWVNNELVVSNVSDGVASVQPGDRIVSIEGEPAASFLDKLETATGGASGDLRRVKAIAALRAGLQPSKIRMTVKSSGGGISEKEFERTTIAGDLAEPRLPAVSEIKPGMFYIDLTRITDKDMRMVLDTLKQSKSIIFDTRGIMLSSEHILGFFSRDNIRSLEWRIPVFTMPDAQTVSYKILTNDIKSRPMFQDKKCVFLSDARSIGYAEGMLAIAKKYKIGQIVGMPTAGAAGEIFGFRLPAGYNVSMTTIFGFDQDGRMIYSHPVQPTVNVELSAAGIAAGHDEVLEKAVSLLEK